MIRLTKYITVISGVGGTGAIGTKELILRVYTNNVLVPVNTVLEFEVAAAVGEYFGLQSEEYQRAVFYFTFISKTLTSPQKISYARFVSVATAPMIFGGEVLATLSDLQDIANGSFSLTLGDTKAIVGPCDFSAITSYANAATVLQTAIRAASAEAQFTAATVTFDNTKTSFNLVGGVADTAAVEIEASGTGTAIENIIQWAPADGLNIIWAPGSDIQTVTEALQASVQISTNFASYTFTTSCGLTLDQIEESAAWNVLQNNAYLYTIGTNTVNYQAWSDALVATAAGSSLSLLLNGFDEQMPSMILASTDYLGYRTVQNYMFYNFAVSQAVSSDSLSDLLDAARVNYYGVTQTNGQTISFYQRGVMLGPNTSPQTMTVYTNEIWFKDAISVVVMNLLLAKPQISADQEGATEVLNNITPVISQAIRNGTIRTNKILTQLQKSYITSLTGDNTAWQQVQTSGFWVSTYPVATVLSNGITEYSIDYTLVYSKDDVVNKINGRHVLI